MKGANFLLPFLFLYEQHDDLGHACPAVRRSGIGVCLGVLCLKSQIPSNKLQIKHKSQYSMTKTFRDERVWIFFGFLNFGHWNFFDICYLEFQYFQKIPMGRTKAWFYGPGFFTRRIIPHANRSCPHWSRRTDI